MDFVTLILFVVGLALLVIGAEALVRGASRLAAAVGISPLVIGLTVVAYGTSSPEMAVSVQSTLAGQADIALSNVVGSNIFNILAVVGLAGTVSSQGLPVSPAALGFDIPVMIAVAVICLPIFFTGGIIARWEGLLFLGYYVAYTAYLILTVTQPQLLPGFETVMLVAVIPLSGLILLISLVRAIKADRPKLSR